MLVGIARDLQPSKNMARNRRDYFFGEDAPLSVAPIAPVDRVTGPGPVRLVNEIGAGRPSPVATAGVEQPDCRRCQHFAVSWDPAVPYLCRGFGFKSRALPSREVMQADGHPCRLFAARA